MLRSLVLAVPHWEPAVEIARAAERAHFFRVWTTESTSRDAMVRSLAVATATSTIGVATGIAYAFTRQPIAMAAAAADLQRASRGRFALGLGAGTRGIRRRYGVDWPHPAPQLAEYARVVRALLEATGPVDHLGRHYQVSLDGFASDPLVAGTEVYASGLNRVMLEHAAAACDGVAVHSLAAAPGYFEQVAAPAIARGAARAGRRTHVACWYIASVNADEEVARDRARRQLAFYLSTPSYHSVADHGGWGAVGDRVRAAAVDARFGDWAKVASEIPDSVVDDLTLAGTPRQVLARLTTTEARLAAGGVHELVLQLVGTEMSADEVLADGLALVDTFAPAR